MAYVFCGKGGGATILACGEGGGAMILASGEGGDAMTLTCGEGGGAMIRPWREMELFYFSALVIFGVGHEESTNGVVCQFVRRDHFDVDVPVETTEGKATTYRWQF